MESMRLMLSDLPYLAPELTLVISAVLLALLDLLLPSRVNRQGLLGGLGLVSILVSMAFVIYYMIDINGSGSSLSLLNNSYRVDDYANIFKLILLTGTALIYVMSFGFIRKQDIEHTGEYYYLLLPATLGAMMMTSSGDLITLFVGLELLSITSYIMVGLRKKNKLSNESAFKYLVTGSIASAFVLYGMSFLYGLSGSTNIAEIRQALSYVDSSMSALVYVSFFLMLAGFGIKIAAAPFHTWAPDVYQGAPTPITAYLAVVSKAAGFAIMMRVLYNAYFRIGSAETPIDLDMYKAFAVVAAVSMIVGNALALRQKNMKRLLAYSGIANAGYLLVPLSNQMGGLHTSNYTELIFYLIAYVFMNLGAFAVLMGVSRSEEHDEMRGFAGLYYRSPWTAVAMTILILSLAGLPVTGGFFGKFYIMLGTVNLQQYWLAAIMILTSVASFYYYFSIIRQMYMRRSTEAKEFKLGAPLAIVVWICTIATLLLGFLPRYVIQFIESIYHISEDFLLF